MAGNNLKVLIVDDEKSLVEMYKLKLEKEGFDVKTAYDWLNALSLISEYLPDLILLDIMMPSMNGFETLSTIRELAPSLAKTKIIMFSNLNSKEDINKALKAWADDYLLKANTTPKEIVEKIKQLLGFEWNLTKKENILCPHCGKDISDFVKNI